VKERGVKTAVGSKMSRQIAAIE